MPFTALLLILSALMPLLAFGTLLAAGRRMGGTVAGYVATAFVSISFICCGWALLRWIGGGNFRGMPYGSKVAPIELTFLAPASTAGGAPRASHPLSSLTIYIDSLTLAAAVTAALASLLVHIFAQRALRREPRSPRLFAVFALATFGALALFLSGSVVQLLVLTELLSIAAFLLLAFRPENQSARRAGRRMFLIHRVGDVGFLLAGVLLISRIGNLSFPELWLTLANAASSGLSTLPAGEIIGAGWLTAVGLLFFLGVASRCAQFPFQFGAADAAQGVATAGAMIYSVTTMMGAVFFLARLFPVLTPSARLVIAVVGVTTFLSAGLVAMVRHNIKAVPGLLAVAQVGCIMMAFGVGSWIGAMFYLIAYVDLQTLVFLAAGGVIRAMQGEADLRRLGGLFSRMPVTACTSALAVLSIAGMGWSGFGLSGYFSRGLILRHAAAFAALAHLSGRSRAYGAFFALMLAGTFVLAFGAMRWWLLVFGGTPRSPELQSKAREATTLYWPLVVLAVMVALQGNWLGARELIESSVTEARQSVRVLAAEDDALNTARRKVFAASWPVEEAGEDATAADPAMVEEARRVGERTADRWAWAGGLLGIAAALWVYAHGLRTPTRLARNRLVRPVHRWLVGGMYFDDVGRTFGMHHLLGRNGSAPHASTDANQDG